MFVLYALMILYAVYLAKNKNVDDTVKAVSYTIMGILVLLSILISVL